jgi:hydroxyethylthiazole kinase-like uncharacterized protein yjeF
MGPEILTVAEIAAADKAAIAGGMALSTLMARAGEAVARAIVARFAQQPVVVLCGPGNNGGDGYVAAQRLREAGWPVTVAGVPRETLTRDAAEAAKGWQGLVAPLSAAAVDDAAIVVDALFGAGLARPLSPQMQALLKAADNKHLVAVDLPSGLDGDSGRPHDYAPQATLTVTFHRKKPAHLLEPGRSFCGEVVVEDIGLKAPEACALNENGPVLWARHLLWPRTDGYKSQRGHLMVVSGQAQHTGAARLAARGGLRVGAGLVTMLSPPSAVLVHAVTLEAVMLTPFKDAAALAQAAADAKAVVIGPAAGVGEATCMNLLALSRMKCGLVVDADALTSFKDDPKILFDALGAGDVMTPHAGEFERVFPGLLNTSASKVEAARAAAGKAGCVVLLKGADTVIAHPDGRAVVNAHAAPWLATAGSGDVLAGLIGGLMAQGMETFQAACAGVWMHGDAAQRFGPGLISEDLPDRVPQVLASLYTKRNP